MTSVLSHDLRLSLGASGGYHPAGWHPKLALTLLGPTPPAAELVWSVSRPDGAEWFCHRVPVPVLATDQHATVELERWGDDDDLDEPGAITFTLRVVSELDGVDQPLLDGRLSVLALPGDHRYAIAGSGMPGGAWLCLDTVDEPDAPRLCLTVPVGGDVLDGQLEAHLFVDGTRLAPATSVQAMNTVTANDGSPTAQSVVAVFDSVRGWNNLAASGWGGEWHLLDARNGHYEVKLVSAARVFCVVPFDVVDGRIVAPGPVEPDPWRGAVICVQASAVGTTEAAAEPSATPDGPGFTVDVAASAAVSQTIDDVYALRHAPALPLSQSSGDTGGLPGAPEGAPEASDASDALEALQPYVDRAERLLLTWQEELAAPPPYDFGQVLAAEAVQRERAGHDELASAVAAVADEQPVVVAGEPTTLGAVRSRAAALFAAADTRVALSQQSADDVLAPYRALLAADKLAVFDDHPADSFVYTTLDGQIIETPEQLAAADYWFFEGPLDLRSSANVEGVEITASTQGWRVLGWRFAPDGTLLDRFEQQGLGPSAPLSAFRPPA